VLLIVFARGYVAVTKQTNNNVVRKDRRLLLSGGNVQSFPADQSIPELRPPKNMYSNAADMGAIKASLSPLKILLLGILSGAHIAFGRHTNYF
jgi:hypothetical protein